MPAPRTPRVTLLLVLGHHFERLVRDGVVKDYAEIARLTGLTRARVTQIVNLTLIAPEIQEKILFSRWDIVHQIHERDIRRLVCMPDWPGQRRLSSGRSHRPVSCRSARAFSQQL